MKIGWWDAPLTLRNSTEAIHVDWRQECREKSIAEESEDTVLINDLEDKTADHEQDVRKMTASEDLGSLNVVKCFAEIHGDKQMNLMLNELTGKVEILKFQNVRRSTIHMFFKEWSRKLLQLT